MKVRVAALAAALAVGCGGDRDVDWDAGVVRAVARRVEAGSGDRHVVVLARLGSAGAEMPFGLRQALTTAGAELTTTRAVEPGARLLVFEDVRRAGADWLVDVRLHDAGDDTGRAVTWRVRCVDGRCEAADSAARPPT